MKLINKQLLLSLSIVLLSSCTVFYDDALQNQKISKYAERVGVINKEIEVGLTLQNKTEVLEKFPKTNKEFQISTIKTKKLPDTLAGLTGFHTSKRFIMAAYKQVFTNMLEAMPP